MYSSLQRIIDLIAFSKYTNRDMFFYEVIPGEKPCNLFFDLEITTEGWSKERWTAALESVIEATTKGFRSLFDIVLGAEVITLL